MADCFLSYSSDDQEIADDIYDQLTDFGLNVSRDVERVEYGDDWYDKLQWEIETCPWFIVLLSSNSEGSKYQQQEISLATNHNKNIIPILVDIEPEEMPSELSRFHALRLSDIGKKDREQELETIAAKIRTDLDQKALITLGGIGIALWLLSKT